MPRRRRAIRRHPGDRRGDQGSRPSVLARANENDDIRCAGEAIRPAKSRRIHTFIATSPIHMEKKLRMTPDQVVEAARRGTACAQYTDDVEFSPRMLPFDLDFCAACLKATIEASAKPSTCRIP